LANLNLSPFRLGPHICGRWRLNFEGVAPGKDDGVVTQSIGEREKND